MKEYLQVFLLFSIAVYSSSSMPEFNKKVHDPKPTPYHWYISEDLHAVKCYGKPYKLFWDNRVVGDRWAVEGCEGPSPQIILNNKPGK